MQAIARANRVDEGKNNGLLIDYNWHPQIPQSRPRQICSN